MIVLYRQLYTRVNLLFLKDQASNIPKMNSDALPGNVPESKNEKGKFRLDKFFEGFSDI
jgi:hypothetical protein